MLCYGVGGTVVSLGKSIYLLSSPAYQMTICQSQISGQNGNNPERAFCTFFLYRTDKQQVYVFFHSVKELSNKEMTNYWKLPCGVSSYLAKLQVMDEVNMVMLSSNMLTTG